jgi:hypothetical protein
LNKLYDREMKRSFCFDIYSGHALVKNIINRNRKGRQKFKILDIGGRGNYLSWFLPYDDVYYLEPHLKSKDKNLIKGNGCCIPLDDKSFDWVTSCDVYEHISKAKRQQFLKENLRVAKLGIILGAPFYSPLNILAEENATKIFETLTGKKHHWFQEHRKNGLPKENDIKKFLDKKYKYQIIDDNDVFLYQLFMSINMIMFARPLKNVERLLKEFNLFYNSKIAPFAPSGITYRKFYFIKKDSSLKNIVREKNLKNSDVSYLKAIHLGVNILNKLLMLKNKRIKD